MLHLLVRWIKINKLSCLKRIICDMVEMQCGLDDLYGLFTWWPPSTSWP